jgi:hypothetical protein
VLRQQIGKEGTIYFVGGEEILGRRLEGEIGTMNSDHRKGELAEIKTHLRQLAGSRAPGVEETKRELYKKVISHMTVGIDVSSLFSEMVMCSATSDLVLKKMCYLYVGNYAQGHPDLALLTINFLQKDCQDDDPMIRGLALRSLCSLRVKNLVEYLVGPLLQGLKDSNSYVRSVAAMGALKLYHISPTACTDNDFLATLKTLLLHDSDSQVFHAYLLLCPLVVQSLRGSMQLWIGVV